MSRADNSDRTPGYHQLGRLSSKVNQQCPQLSDNNMLSRENSSDSTLFNQSPRRQLGRLSSKVSKPCPQISDFFGVEQAKKPDVLGMPGWENPMETASGRDCMPVHPRRSQRAPQRKIERHVSAPVNKQRLSAKSNCAESRDIIFNPPPMPPQRSGSRDRSFENMVIDCNGYKSMDDSFGDLTVDSYANSYLPHGITPLPQLNSTDPDEERSQLGHNQDCRPPSAFGPRRTISIIRAPESAPALTKSRKEERSVQLSLTKSWHGEDSSLHSRISAVDISIPSLSNHSVSTAGGYCTIHESREKIRGSRGPDAHRSRKGIMKCGSNDGLAHSNITWRKLETSLLDTQEQEHKNFVPRLPSRTSSLDPALALRRLAAVEHEKRMCDATLRWSPAVPASVVSQSSTSMSEDELAVREAQEEELLAVALQRSLREM